jgi:hypothetical protein
MTEAEMLEIVQSMWGNYLSTMSIFISVISAYLIIAYMAGDKLTKAQMALVNVLMGIFCSIGIAAMHGYSTSATELTLLSLEMSTQRTQIGMTTVPLITLLVFPPLILASYKFMWDIRHSKTE